MTGLADKRIVLLSDSGTIPSLYVRFVDPIQHVTHNYNLVSSVFPGAEMVARDADLLVVHRWFGSSIRAMVDEARRRGVPVIYETDDNLLDLSDETALALTDEHRANIKDVLVKADLVICSTYKLADALGVYNRNVTILENYGLNKPITNLAVKPHLAVVNTDYFKLKSTKADFFEALGIAVSQLDYQITFFGTVDPATVELKERHPDHIRIIEGFVDDRAAFLHLLLDHEINVGVVPLDDTRQHSYKSDIKFLDFASIGVAGIYNNKTVYAAVRHRVDGFICDDSLAGWLDGLTYLADSTNRVELGHAAREVVRKDRSIENYAARLGDHYRRLLGVAQRERDGGTDEGECVMHPEETIGLFWNDDDLCLLHEGRRRHVVAAEAIPALLEAGIGFVEPGADLRRRLISGPPFSGGSHVAELIRARPAAPRNIVPASSGRPLRIAWIVPGLIIGGGGHRNVIRCAYHLERLGHDVSLYFIDTAESGIRNAQIVREHFYPFAGHIGLLDRGMAPVDFVVATHWSTIKYAELLSSSTREIVYFVQDFEPSFYAMGSEYILAEATYRKGYYAITSGIWCENFLRETFGCEADHFQFPIDREVYFPKGTSRRRRVIFFAKPEMPRRCYEVGVAALRLFHASRREVEIAFYGSTFAAQSELGFPVTQLGMLPGPSDLADLYRDSTLGVVFSTTNPSLVPYEMMACGLPVVDLGRPGNELNYGGSHDVALLADPDPVMMAMDLANIVDNQQELTSRSELGIAFTRTFPTEAEVGRRIESLLLKRAATWIEL